MTEESKADPGAPTGGGDEQPPPFEPDEDLITYLEKGRDMPGATGHSGEPTPR